MTIEKFNKIQWTGGMMAEYDYKEYMVVAPNFEDKTILLEDEDGSIGYIDCEKVEIIGESK